MNSSRENQEDTSEAKEAKVSRAEAYDKWLCWNSGHNAREREIVAHMTPEERRGFQRLSALAGALFGVMIAGGMAIVMLLPSDMGFGVAGRIVVGVLYLPLVCLVVLRVRHASQKFMRNTAWSKAQDWEQ